MLNEMQKNKFDNKAKAEIIKLLQELHISLLTDNNIGILQNELDLRVCELVNQKESGNKINENLLDIFDLLTDIVLDNQDDLKFLNSLFLNK